MSQPLDPGSPPTPSSPPVIGYATPYNLIPTSGGAWRDGATVVLPKSSQLPYACVKCGGSPQKALKRNMTWYPPLAYLGLLAGVLPFAIIAMIMQKKATVLVPMCSRHLQARKRFILIAWGIGLAGLAIAVVGSEMADEAEWIAVGVFFCFAGIIFGVISASLLKAKKIDDQYAYLTGAGAGFLSQLPNAPTPAAQMQAQFAARSPRGR